MKLPFNDFAGSYQSLLVLAVEGVIGAPMLLGPRIGKLYLLALKAIPSQQFPIAVMACFLLLGVGVGLMEVAVAQRCPDLVSKFCDYFHRSICECAIGALIILIWIQNLTISTMLLNGILAVLVGIYRGADQWELASQPLIGFLIRGA